MIIKLIPENDFEKRRFEEKLGVDQVEYSGVNEYFLMGNKRDENGEASDFHEWIGSHRYIASSLMYFVEIMKEERRSPPQQVVPPRPKVINFQNENPPIQANEQMRIVKQGKVQDQNISVVDTSNIRQSPRIIQMNPNGFNRGEPRIVMAGERIEPIPLNPKEPKQPMPPRQERMIPPIVRPLSNVQDTVERVDEEDAFGLDETPRITFEKEEGFNDKRNELSGLRILPSK